MPPVLDPPVKIPRSRFGRRSAAQKIASLALRLVVLLLFIGFVLGGLVSRGDKGFRPAVAPAWWKNCTGRRSLIQRLTLDPFRGLVAKDVRIFDYKNRENTLALISEISLDINYAALIHHEPFLNALDVRNAQLIFPIRSNDPKAPRAQLTRFRAHVYFPPEQIYVSQAEGIFCGVRISATGQLIKRQNYVPSAGASEEEWQARLRILQRIVTELGKFTFPADVPRLQVKFSGDLSQLEDAHFEASLHCDHIQRGAYTMRNFSANAEWIGQRLNLTQCEWQDDAGSLAARASWTRQSGVADFQLRSTLNLKTFLESFGFPQLLDGMTFSAPPLLDISGTLPFGDLEQKKNVIGRVALENFDYKSVPSPN